jgi:hypothetical protein
MNYKYIAECNDYSPQEIKEYLSFFGLVQYQYLNTLWYIVCEEPINNNLINGKIFNTLMELELTTNET